MHCAVLSSPVPLEEENTRERRALGRILGGSEGAILKYFGAILGYFGAILAYFGAILDYFGAILGPWEPIKPPYLTACLRAPKILCTDF